MWIGTYGGGLSRLKDGHFVNLTSLNGLPDNFISGIEEDDRGNLWVSTRSGIFRISKKLVDDFADGQIGSVRLTASPLA